MPIDVIVSSHYDDTIIMRPIWSLEAVLKTLLGFKVKAGPSVQPEEYTKYFEDWTPGPNKGFEFEKVF